MCGILGLIHKDAQACWPDLSATTLATLAHRGPDSTGVLSDAHIQFGHTRLSIIDLTSAGHQPMTYAQGRYTVTYNGEIYNYLELRAELEALGEAFASHSDTEVLLAAYRVWGEACVQRFIGPFAFAIWDNLTRKAFLARDRCGEKPLFYSVNDSTLAFASELKGLLPLLEHTPALNPKAVDMYLHYQYVPEPLTLLQGVHKLAAGHTLTLAVDQWQIKPVQYWSVEQASNTVVAPPQNMAKADILSAIQTGLEEAVKLTLRSDVPVGIALSGGVDSGAIAALAQKNYPEPMHAFCVGYPGRPPYDEREQARGLAESLGMIVHEVELPVEQFVEFFPTLVEIMDEPIADPAAFGHYSVPRAAADQGIKVLLSGVGGDELFWGYPYVKQAVQLNQLALQHPTLSWLASWFTAPGVQTFLLKVAHYPHVHPVIKRAADTLQKLSDPHQPKDQLFYYLLHPEFAGPYAFKSQLYGPTMASLASDNAFEPTDIGLRAAAQVPAAVIRLLFETWLTSNCLSLGDRVSMGVGVETRMPFLDANLIGLVMALRTRYPDDQLGQKVWLREALQGVLPAEVLARPKAGFQPPVNEWLSGVVKRYADALVGGHLQQAGILAAERVSDICTTLPQQGYTGLFLAYKLVLLELWYQKVVMQ
ncbi:MAG: asparagine synthase (glutamine-hydrolyzing) [Candidatus Methylopumilus sp.]|nr:asparagine synthase (glutamine-hydrolyzing) [Candidatus Methylopumilus sp.]